MLRRETGVDSGAAYTEVNEVLSGILLKRISIRRPNTLRAWQNLIDSAQRRSDENGKRQLQQVQISLRLISLFANLWKRSCVPIRARKRAAGAAQPGNDLHSL